MTKSNIARLGLGTVQFGLDYGLSNDRGQVPFDEATRIVRTAARLGIDTLDTAALYGDSEERLGRLLKPDSSFRVVSKTIKINGPDIGQAELNRLKQAVERSRRTLCHAQTYDLLIHDVDDLFKPGGERLIETLRTLQDDSIIKKIGLSVYTGEQIDHALKIFTPQLIQLPLNVLDQRLIDSGHLRQLKNIGVEIHARSIFLQGLLLMKPLTLDRWFGPIQPLLKNYHSAIEESGLTPLQAALQFVVGQKEIDRLIVGVCSVREIEEIGEAVSKKTPGPFDYKPWALKEPDFLNPSLWQLSGEPVAGAPVK